MIRPSVLLRRFTAGSVFLVGMLALPTSGLGQPPPEPTDQSPPPYDPNMQAGGLTPPPPMTAPPSNNPPASTSPTEQDLDRAKEKDSGRGLNWVYLYVDG